MKYRDSLCKEFERLHKWMQRKEIEEACEEVDHNGFREQCIFSDCEECNERKNVTSHNKD